MFVFTNKMYSVYALVSEWGFGFFPHTILWSLCFGWKPRFIGAYCFSLLAIISTLIITFICS